MNACVFVCTSPLHHPQNCARKFLAITMRLLLVPVTSSKGSAADGGASKSAHEGNRHVLKRGVTGGRPIVASRRRGIPLLPPPLPAPPPAADPCAMFTRATHKTNLTPLKTTSKRLPHDIFTTSSRKHAPRRLTRASRGPKRGSRGL